MDRDVEHLRLLSIFHYIMGGLAVVFGCIFIIYIILGLVIASSPQMLQDPRGNGAPAFVGLIFTFVGFFALAMTWLQGGLLILSGYFLSQRKNYTFCLVIAALSCLAIPMGTILGIFTIIVLQRPRVRQLFGQPVTTL